MLPLIRCIIVLQKTEAALMEDFYSLIRFNEAKSRDSYFKMKLHEGSLPFYLKLQISDFFKKNGWKKTSSNYLHSWEMEKWQPLIHEATYFNRLQPAGFRGLEILGDLIVFTWC